MRFSKYWVTCTLILRCILGSCGFDDLPIWLRYPKLLCYCVGRAKIPERIQPREPGISSRTLRILGRDIIGLKTDIIMVPTLLHNLIHFRVSGFIVYLIETPLCKKAAV